MGDWAVQSGSGIRFEWGPAGAGRLASEAACLVIVDGLSFTTAVSVAGETGIRVLPFWLPDGPVTTAGRAASEKAAAVCARQSGARLAVARRAVTPDSPWSLSPAHLRRAPFVVRLVLPSPNGAAIAAAASPHVRVIVACLRNISAGGSWLTARRPSLRRRTSAPSYPCGIPSAPSPPAEAAGLTYPCRLRSATLWSATRGGPWAVRRAVWCVLRAHRPGRHERGWAGSPRRGRGIRRRGSQPVPGCGPLRRDGGRPR